MSYCRFAWDNSDVYMYEGNEGIVCCCCKIFPEGFVGNITETIEHLSRHLFEGHIVPRYAFDRLLDEYYEKHKPKPLPKWQVKLNKQLSEFIKKSKHNDLTPSIERSE
jgi:hypothetical protein